MRRTTVDKRVFGKALPKAREMLKQKLSEMLAAGEVDLSKALEGVNSVRSRLESKMTYQQYFEVLRSEAEKNTDFKKIIEAVRESCRIAIDKTRKELSA